MSIKKKKKGVGGKKKPTAKEKRDPFSDSLSQEMEDCPRSDVLIWSFLSKTNKKKNRQELNKILEHVRQVFDKSNVS